MALTLRAVLALMLAIVGLACGDDGDDSGSSGAGGMDVAGDGSGGVGGDGSGGMGGSGGSGSGGMDGSGGMGGSGGSGSGGMDGSGGTGSGGTGSGGTGGSGGSGGAGATSCVAPSPAETPGNACPDGDPVTLTATPVKTDFNNAVTAITAPPGDSDRIFVALRGGQIEVLERDSGNSLGTFLDFNVSSGSMTGDERGLLGLAFHPDYPEDPRFFVNYTSGNPGLSTYISAFEVSADDPNRADMDSEQALYDFTQPAPNHNGGMVAFGPDGCLYVGTGDGGGANDQYGAGQDVDVPLAKILRFDVDAPDSAAPGNPGVGDIPHTWDYGLRNPWRFSFDRMTGDLYIGDVGQGGLGVMGYEEVDVVPAGVGGNNFGWPITEGFDCRSGSCDQPGLVDPVHDYTHGSGNNCVIGGYVYRGQAVPSLQGWYVYADNGSSNTWAFVWDGATTCDDPISLSGQLSVQGDITTFGEDADGEMYIGTVSGGGGLSGAVYRIEAN